MIPCAGRPDNKDYGEIDQVPQPLKISVHERARALRESISPEKVEHIPEKKVVTLHSDREKDIAILARYDPPVSEDPAQSSIDELFEFHFDVPLHDDPIQKAIEKLAEKPYFQKAYCFPAGQKYSGLTLAISPCMCSDLSSPPPSRCPCL